MALPDGESSVGTNFKAVEAAKRKIDELIELNGGAAAGHSAEEILIPWNLTVTQAACLVDRALSKLRPLKADIENAVQFFVEPARNPITVNDAVDRLLEEKQRDTGKHNARDLESRLKKRFCLQFDERQSGEISRAEISKWIQGLPHAKRGPQKFSYGHCDPFPLGTPVMHLPEDKPTRSRVHGEAARGNRD